ncbi:MAG: coproporphyrinogen III oxidase [Rickettsiaceae bacterium]|nr:coproporphyrinogen III oxidase [Rickettsiaceae bacterium]
MVKNYISIYVHWPFCLSLCPYCDFNSHILQNIDYDLWCSLYNTEIDFFKSNITGKYIKSIFFGGGTPSLMPPKLVQSILDSLAHYGIIDSNTEITLETNPTSYEADKFKNFKNAGINRVSIGIQSIRDENLKFLGRNHSASEAIKVVTSAAEIFDRYSVDLIYALPNQTLQDWQYEMKEALKFVGKHISLYQLTIEKGTPFYSLHKRNAFSLPPEDVSADMYEWTNQYLSEYGYNRYEISNYAYPGEESVHNLTYWNYEEYLGIGAGAHSRLHIEDKIVAIMMINAPQKWATNITEYGHAIQTRKNLLQKDIIKEHLMMGTRLISGLNQHNFYATTGKKFAEILDQHKLNQYQELGLVTFNHDIMKLTDKGLMLHNYIIAQLALDEIFS